MYGRDAISRIDWRRYRLTHFRVAAICSGLLAIAVFVSVQQFTAAEENVLPGGAPVGGDFVAFYGAAIAASEGDAAQMYDYPAFEAQLQRVGPPLDEFKLTWQYPPTYFLIILPFAFLPFIPGYIAWDRRHDGDVFRNDARNRLQLVFSVRHPGRAIGVPGCDHRTKWLSDR